LKIDIHNHGVPETVLEFFAAEPQFGIRIIGERHMRGGAEGEYELEPEFSDADAKLADLEAHGLDGAVVSIDPPFFYYEVEAGAGAALAEVVKTACAPCARGGRAGCGGWRPCRSRIPSGRRRCSPSSASWDVSASRPGRAPVQRVWTSRSSSPSGRPRRSSGCP
jgi:hypothetical protein